MTQDDGWSTQLNQLREKIDSLDEQILQLITQRGLLAKEVGEVKAHTDAPIFRPEREIQVLQRLAKNNAGPLSTEHIHTIFGEIISACRSLEKRMFVAYLGPSGTFTEQALITHFGRSVEMIPCTSIDEVFRAVEAGTADFGVVPVENSTEGSVNRTLDLFLHTPLRICGEVALAIHHNLLTQTGNMQGITRVCAHAQALAQCQHWLNDNYPQLDRLPVSSNAEAARLASQDNSIAAIAGDVAATRYQLKAVMQHVEDDPHNRTRFAIIGQLSPAPSGQDHTGLILSVPNQAGAMHALTAPFAKYGVSLTRFESRPARTGKWDYYFYVDIEGHESNEKVAQVLNELKQTADFFKLLGSYPVR